MDIEFSTARAIIDHLRNNGVTVTRVGLGGGGGVRFNNAVTDQIMEYATATDSATLDTSNGGFVWLVWGNGFDVIADYSDNMEEYLAPIYDRLAILERLEIMERPLDN